MTVLALSWWKPAATLTLVWLGMTPAELLVAAGVASTETLAVLVGPVGPEGPTGPAGIPIDEIDDLGTVPSVSPNIDLYKQIKIENLDQDLVINSPVGTAHDGKKLIIRIRDDGSVSRAISWAPEYISGGPGFIVSTTPGKLITFGFMYDSTVAKWVLQAAMRQP